MILETPRPQSHPPFLTCDSLNFGQLQQQTVAMDLSERLEAEVAKSSALQRENERLKDDMVKLAGSLAGKLEALDVEQGTESTVSPSEQDDLDAAAPALAPRNSRAGSIKDIAEEENEMVALATGDLIWLKQDGECCVWPRTTVPSSSFNSFNVCPL